MSLNCVNIYPYNMRGNEGLLEQSAYLCAHLVVSERRAGVECGQQGPGQVGQVVEG